MFNQETLEKLVNKEGMVKTADIAKQFGVTRQYASLLLSRLVREGKVVKTGSTRASLYMSLEYTNNHPQSLETRYSKKLKNVSLEEHKILDDIERNFRPFQTLPENIKSIFTYAFSEMLNNAIDHSQSKNIDVSVSLKNDELTFTVQDYGIGVYRNIMQKRELSSEIEAIQDLLKGKMTTAPKLHSGEGIFFTSKVGDSFLLDSFGQQFLADNEIKDIFVRKTKGFKRGTVVTFTINTKDKHHLNDIFKKYTDFDNNGDHGFDKTVINVRLYTMGGVHISRSQARRVLSGLEKFKIVVMDYDKVPMVGQAFADEVYRVFQQRHPESVLENSNMNEAVSFMVNRAKTEAKLNFNK